MLTHGGSLTPCRGDHPLQPGCRPPGTSAREHAIGTELERDGTKVSICDWSVANLLCGIFDCETTRLECERGLDIPLYVKKGAFSIRIVRPPFRVILELNLIRGPVCFCEY